MVVMVAFLLTCCFTACLLAASPDVLWLTEANIFRHSYQKVKYLLHLLGNIRKDITTDVAIPK